MIKKGARRFSKWGNIVLTVKDKKKKKKRRSKKEKIKKYPDQTGLKKIIIIADPGVRRVTSR